MLEIKTFPFNKSKFNELKDYHFGLNWPVVYIQENGKEMYVGQTTSLYGRSKQHYEKESRRKLTRLHVLTDEEFNISACYDFESLLIQYIAAEGSFKLQNRNGGLVNHNYFDREKYTGKFDAIWSKLQEKKLVTRDINELKNSEFFKFSPYKALTEDQILVARRLERIIKKGASGSFIVNGGPGTGKTILALYLLKRLCEEEYTKHLSIALVVPMTGLRTTLQRVIRRVPGMSARMIIGPGDVVKKKYDLLLIDEAHRLRRRVALTSYKPYDDTNRLLKLPKEATQLDWITESSAQQIFFYDAQQSVVPGDVRPSDFDALGAIQFELTSQLRVEGGEDYLRFVDELLSLKKVGSPKNYDFQIYDDFREFIKIIRQRNSEYTLSRLVAGYAWPWTTKGKKDGYDIEIEGIKLIWNSTNIDWVSSSNSINEVGCIHTIQGYDLNYVGVIIGPELSYDEKNGTLVVDKEKYKDKNGKKTANPAELEGYIINIYKTLLTRGIKGTYVYIVDPKLREHLKKNIETKAEIKVTHPDSTLSPITLAMVRVPLVGSAPCGNPLLGEENIEEYVEVDKRKIRAGFAYFILRAEGDSMNLAGINDGDLVLCRQQLKADTGDRVVALLGGENVTIKYYDKQDGRRVLLPKSSNGEHQPILPDEGDSVQGVVQEVITED